MFDRRPWIVADRADTLTAERRPPPLKRADEWVLRAFARLRGATGAPGPLARIEAARVLRASRALQDLDEAALVRLVTGQRPALLAGGFRSAPLRQAVAGICEMAHRRLGMRPYPVQVMGGLGLLRGRIVEMATGEGKTLTGLLPAITAALAGVPVHVVTVNGYLSRRDAETLRPVIEAFGLTVGTVTEDTEPRDRAVQYAADVVFTTNKDVAFDYLRDRIALGRRPTALADLAHSVLAARGHGAPRILCRGLGFAIVDELDSILIDESQTPLIITAEAQRPEGDMAEETLLALAGQMTEDEHFRCDRKKRSIRLLPAAERRIETMEPPVPSLRPLAARREALIRALSALHLYHRDEHYILTDEGIAIVDEFTGRVMGDRQWQKGLHQMIEIKEKVAASPPRDTLAQITYQTFFGRYLWFSGMTGTAREVARELRLRYGRPVYCVPPNRRRRRRDLVPRLYGAAERRWRAVVVEAGQMLAAGRPVLIGTRSVEASERVAGLLRAAGIAPEVLNARQDGDEAAIVARAGEAARVTVATNMAGRGTDIPVPADVEARGGLHVILTEYHLSPRIDRQFLGRTGRQGQRGSTVALVSLEDALFADTVPGLVHMMRFLSGGVQGRLPSAMARLLCRRAQARAEAMGRARRTRTLRHAEQLERSLGFRPDNI